jgi:hypothetical protein
MDLRKFNSTENVSFSDKIMKFSSSKFNEISIRDNYTSDEYIIFS